MGSPINPGAPSFGAALDFIQSRFGGSFREVDGSQDVADVPVQIVPFDAERVALIVMNLGGEEVYIAPNTSVTTTRGIRLDAAGGALVTNADQDALLPCLPWYGRGPTNAVKSVYFLIIKRERIGQAGA